MIVAVIKVIRMIVQNLQKQARDSDNFVAACFFWICSCILGILDSIVEYVNVYAYSSIAIYGKPYFEAAHDAWQLLTS
ncbi:MAG: hypothetical protein Q7U31_09975, partial [Anaerolineaceae bacterium]|nr:hypothetical protein [Anaerolineaceae bacterium]